MVEKVFSDDLLMNKFDFFVNVIDNNLTFFENARELYIERVKNNANEIEKLTFIINNVKGLDAAQVAVVANKLRRLTFENEELEKRLMFIQKIRVNTKAIKRDIKTKKSA